VKEGLSMKESDRREEASPVVTETSITNRSRLQSAECHWTQWTVMWPIHRESVAGGRQERKWLRRPGRA